MSTVTPVTRVLQYFGAKTVALMLMGDWDLLESDGFSEVVTVCVTTIFYYLFYLL